MLKLVYSLVILYLLHAFSSDSSLHSGLPLQNSSFSIHSPLPHDNFPSGQTGSSVLKMGNTFLGSKHVDGGMERRENKLATKTLENNNSPSPPYQCWCEKKECLCDFFCSSFLKDRYLRSHQDLCVVEENCHVSRVRVHASEYLCSVCYKWMEGKENLMKFQYEKSTREKMRVFRTLYMYIHMSMSDGMIYGPGGIATTHRQERNLWWKISVQLTY